MPTKQQLAVQIAAIEQPNEAPDLRAFYVTQLVAGFSKTQLEAKLLVAKDFAAPSAPEVPPRSPEAVQEHAGGPQPDSGYRPAAEPGTALEPVSATDLAQRGQLPDEARWTQMERIAARVCKSSLAPPYLRGKPDDTLLVLLGAHDLGISSTQGLQKLIVIEGKLAMSAELMVALVLRDGHRIWPADDNDRTKATAHAQRNEGFGEWGPVVDVTFTLDDAVAAGLITLNKETGLAWCRSKNGNKLPWELYTPDLLWARAVSRMARKLFPDCLAGITYVPEELGFIEQDGDSMAERAAVQEEATVTLHQQQSNIAARIADLPDDLRIAMREEWKARRLPKPTELKAAAVRTALTLLEAAEQRAAERVAAEPVIPDAELVEDDTVDATTVTAEVTRPAPPADPDDEVTDGEVIADDKATMCACGDGPATESRPFVFTDDGVAFHVDDAPFLP